MGELIPPRQNQKEQSKSCSIIAKTFNTNSRYISDAKKLKAENPVKFEEVKRGEKTITEVKREIKTIQKKADVKKTRVDIELPTDFINGDALEEIAKLENGSVDILITDPPYGINYKSNRSVYSDSITATGIKNDSPAQAFELLDKTCSLLLDKMANNSHLYIF